MPSAVSTDLEKGRSNHGSISRPAYDWTPQASFAPRTQGPVSRTAPPAHPPNSIPQGQGFGSGSRLSSLRRSPFQGHRKSSASTDSSSRLLTPEPSSRGHSPSPSLNSLDSVSTIGRPIAPASVLDAAELSAPPQAIQKSMQTVPQLHLLTAQASPIGPTGLTPSPRRKRAPLSTNLSPIPGSPAVPLSAAPPSAAPFHEVTLNTPAPQPSPTSDGVSSLISMYFSRKSASSAELPPFPTNAGSRDSTLDFTSTSASEVESLSAFPAVPVLTPPEAALRPLKATVSVGAVGGARGPMATPPPLPTPPPAPQALPSPGLSASSPSYYTTDASDYSESEAGSPPPLPSFPRAPTALQPTQPLRLSKVGPPMDAKPSTGLGPGVVGDDAVGAALERPPSRQLPERPRPGIERPASRALPVPPDAVPGLAGRWPVPPSVTGLHSRSRSLVTGQSHVSHSRQDSAASAHPGYL
ncbi:hypothetical protein BC834DRAFT_467041 [Gloeopeniophorella convolvens]|nr:hypothetical protein BC834DRAFT_467041 [Gloeopeniophorella convolvens]